VYADAVGADPSRLKQKIREGLVGVGGRGGWGAAGDGVASGGGGREGRGGRGDGVIAEGCTTGSAKGERGGEAGEVRSWRRGPWLPAAEDGVRRASGQEHVQGTREGGRGEGCDHLSS